MLKGAIMNKIDLIIDALQDTDSKWSYRKRGEALAAARELQQELAKPEQVFGGMTDREAMTMALRILANKRLRTDEHLIPIVVDALRQALAQPEQEPVAYVEKGDLYWCDDTSVYDAEKLDGHGLYTAPSPKPWVGLTDEEIKEVLGLNETSWSLSGVALQHVMDDARALETKLKEKNGG
jgi:hypothetical protein